MDDRERDERLADLLASGLGAAPADAPDLTAAVLARTCGPACGRAGELLASLPDGAPALGDAQLLHAHLEHCPACRAVSATFGWLAPELRAMAEVAPDARFTADVLAATAAARARAGARRRSLADRVCGPLERLAENAGVWWRRQLLRPRVAMEFAYVATMLLLALCATPISPLRGAPEKALAVVKASPAGLASVTIWVWDTLPEGVTGLGRGAWDLTGGRATRAIDGAAARLEARARRTAPQRAALGRHLGDAGRSLSRFDFVQAAVHWSEARTDLKDFWRAWRAGGKAARTAPEAVARARA